MPSMRAVSARADVGVMGKRLGKGEDVTLSSSILKTAE